MGWLTALEFIKKYWKLGIAVILVSIIGITVLYAYFQHNKAQTLSIKYQNSLNTISQQEHSIETISKLNSLIDKQNQDRKKLITELDKQSNEISDKLNKLKESNDVYKKCSNTELPYSIDSMFGNSASN